MSTDLYTLDLPALTAQVKLMGQPGFRAKQLWKWMYERGARDFSEMTDLPKGFREKLAAECRPHTRRFVAAQCLSPHHV